MIEAPEKVQKYLKACISNAGLSQEYVALQLFVGSNNLRQWIKKGVIPGGVAEDFARLVNTSVDTLKERGVTIGD